MSPLIFYIFSDPNAARFSVSTFLLQFFQFSGFLRLVFFSKKPSLEKWQSFDVDFAMAIGPFLSEKDRKAISKATMALKSNTRSIVRLMPGSKTEPFLTK